MENYENIPQPNTPKESPFADSPYVMEPAQAPVYTQEDQPAPQPKEKRRGTSPLKTFTAALLVIALVAVGCGLTGFGVSVWHEQRTEQLVTDFQAQIDALKKEIEKNSFTGNGNSVSGTPVAAEGLTPGQIHAQNKSSVVGISNRSTTTNIFGQVTQTASSGSGFIISEDGYIVTNYHVIENAKTLTVITDDAQEYSATVVGYDDGNDFALIKVDAAGLKPVKLGSSDDLIVGDQVVAIGNPLGELTNSLTVGYISAKDRDVNTSNSIINMLQTDAAINPGNSGGPLFNMKGEVIGITTAKYASTTVENIAFAIPIDDVTKMIDDLLKTGHISTPYMGVNINNSRDGMGVYVISVEDGTPAAAAGIKAGDTIVGIGEYETPTLASLDKVLRNFNPNDTTTIHVYRNRQVLELTITFGSKQPLAS